MKQGEGRPRQTVHKRHADGVSGAAPRLVACAVVALVATAVAVFAVSSVFSGGDAAPVPVADEPSPVATSGKLDGAMETMDEGGIVHGTTPAGVNYLLWGRDQESLSTDKVMLVAAGDQIGTDQVLGLADGYAGAVGDGAYDFAPFYQEVAPFVQGYDLRFINQETVMAGADEYGYSGYPSFNTPDAAADALADVGFNMVNLATNHVLDYGTDAATRSRSVWDAYSQVSTAGSYVSEADRETVRLVERDGMTFAFLAFCYGDNYYQEDLPDTWHLCGFDKAAIEADVRRAQLVADAVIVAMHWGTEYVEEPNEQQLDYATFLADLDVDLVLGTHAHTLQPVRLVTGTTGNTVPVVFGLSDFVSGWGKADFVLSGLFTCDFTRVYDDGQSAGKDAERDVEGAEGATAAAASTTGAAGTWHVEVGNLMWHPTIEWSDGGPTYVRFLKDMDEATTNANVRITGLNYDQSTLEGVNLYAYLREKTAATMADITIDW